MHDTPPAPRPGLLPRLVGLFALAQLVFLPLANLLELVPLRPASAEADALDDPTQRRGRFTPFEPAQRAAEHTASALTFWAELSGQEQGWNMFTRGLLPRAVVPVAELRFPDGTAWRVRSRFDPLDPVRPPARAPLIHVREFNIETSIGLLGTEDGPEPSVERVRDHEALLTRWLSWQAKRHRSAHPDSPAPSEVVLILRYLPLTGATNQTTVERPLARWLPSGLASPGHLPLEAYDPQALRFVPLKEWP